MDYHHLFSDTAARGFRFHYSERGCTVKGISGRCSIANFNGDLQKICTTAHSGPDMFFVSIPGAARWVLCSNTFMFRPLYFIFYLAVRNVEKAMKIGFDKQENQARLLLR